MLISALGTCGMVLSWQGILGSSGKFEYIGPILLFRFIIINVVFAIVVVIAILVSSLHVVCSLPAIHLLITYLENCIIPTLYLLLSALIFKDQNNILIIVSSSSAFEGIASNVLVDRVPHQPSLAPCLKLQVIDISKNTALFILFISRRIMLYHKKTNNSLYVTTLSGREKKHRLYSQSEDFCPMFGPATFC